MRLLTIGLCWLSVGPVAAQERLGAADEGAVREVVQRYMAARADRDEAAIGALFTEDADQYTTSGEWRRGRAAVVPGTLAASSRNPGSRAIEIEAVRFLTPAVAIVDGPYTIGARRLWTTFVLTREGGAWQIAAIRNMAPTSPVAPTGP